MSKEWQADYNTERPHKSLGYLSPVKFAEQRYKRRESLQQLSTNSERKYFTD